MDNIEISLLVENKSYNSNNLLGELGLSMHIKYKVNKLLFDTGISGLFLENSKKLGIDLNEIELIILSHHHYDHVGGIINTNFADNKFILAHSDVFKKVGEKIKGNYKKIVSDDIHKISDEIFFLGEIPRKTSFEKGNYGNDSMLDDTALAVKTEKGIVIITGCSHSGIINICEYAKQVIGEKQIYGVLGGFHLLKDSRGIDSNKRLQIDETISYFKKENLKYLLPFHCINSNILSEFRDIFNIEKLSTGSKIIIK